MATLDSRITLLTQGNSYLHHIMRELRDVEMQNDRLRFRHNLEKAGEILAYEMSKQLSYKPEVITTPLGTLEVPQLVDQPVVASIMRAGLPVHVGALRMLDKADNGFISAYRHHSKGNKFQIKIEYLAAPNLAGRDLILLDPMIATGQSMVLAYQALIARGRPENVFLGGVIASEAGLDYVKKHIPEAKIWVCAVDGELTAKSYIVPGLGDAGDLAFGEKE